MIKILRDTRIDNSELSKLVIKYGETTVSLDKSSIEHEIDRLNKLRYHVKNDKAKDSIDNTLKYLEELRKRAAKGKLNLRVYMDKRRVSSIPVEVVRIPELNINTVDFMESDGKTLVSLDFDEAISAILFEACYVDLGYSLEEIEIELEKVNIITRNQPTELLKLMDNLKFTQIANMRMGDCTWVSSDDTNSCISYFGDKVLCNKMYKPLAKEMAHKFINKMLYDLCKYKLSKLENASIIGVYETSIDVFVDNGTDLDILKEDIVINVFGRKFDFRPVVTAL